MTEEVQKLESLRRERIARTKKFLRKLPRRTNIHRYPILKWFSSAARKRSWMWSFRVEFVVPAIYCGVILALLPLYGVQLILAFILALVFRANLPVIVAAQFITNPLTVIPIYFTAYQIGKISLNLIGIQTPVLSLGEARALFLGMHDAQWSASFQYVATVFGVTTLGSTMMGLFVAAILSLIYRAMAHEIKISYQRLVELRIRRDVGKTENE